MKIVVIDGDASSLLTVRGPLLKRLVELDHEVHALAPIADDSVVADIEALGVNFDFYSLFKGKFSPLADLTTMSQIKQALFRIKPDVVLSISSKPMTYGSMAAKMAWVDHKKRIYALVNGLGYPFTEKAGIMRRIAYAFTKYMMGGGLGTCTGIIFRNAEDEAFFRKFGVINDRVKTTIIDEPLPVEGQEMDAAQLDAATEALLSFMELT